MGGRRRRVGGGGDGGRQSASPPPPPSSRWASGAAQAAAPLRVARCDLSAALPRSALSAGSRTSAQIAAAANLPAPPSLPLSPSGRPAPARRRGGHAPAGACAPLVPAPPGVCPAGLRGRAEPGCARPAPQPRSEFPMCARVQRSDRVVLICNTCGKSPGPPRLREGAGVTILGARPSTGVRPGITGLMVEWQVSAEARVEGRGAEPTQQGLQLPSRVLGKRRRGQDLSSQPLREKCLCSSSPGRALPFSHSCTIQSFLSGRLLARFCCQNKAGLVSILTLQLVGLSEPLSPPL